MASKTKIILEIYLFFFVFSISSFDAADPLWKWCSNSNNYTANSVFANNLNTLLTSIASNTSIVNFATFTQGSGDDTAYALAQCRGDSIPSTCRSCLADAAAQITKSCPNQKSATLLYDDNSSNNTAPACLLRYDNSSFFGSVDPAGSGMAMANPNDIPDNTTFNPLLQQLLANLTATATATAHTIVKYFAVGNTPWKTFQKLYGMVQCTQDLSAANCALCINNEIEQIPSSTVYNKQGGRLYTRSCWIRFDMNQFYTAPTTSSSPDSPPPPGNETTAPTPAGSTNAVANSKSTTIIIVAAVVAAALLVVILLVFFVCGKKRRNARSTEEDTEDLEAIEALYFSLSTIRAATNNFSDKNKLGEGGYGPVYKGRLKDGKEIAVKRMSSHSGQGMTEFKNEVQLIAKLQHRNLVRLFGCCVEDKEKILVYEFLPNTSLDHFLFDPTRKAELDWSTRFKIIVGTARGILYLHEDSRLKIIHRDLKVSNVLLDSEMNPKIADFGLAKLVNLDETQYNTNRIAGTFGYMSPEYVMQGKFSVKSDVFSFGVLVLEIISGQKNSSFSGTDGAVDMLVHTWRLWRDGRALDLLDQTLWESAPRSDVLRCIHIALLCVQELAEDRPHMSSIVFMLNSTSMTLPSPLPPAFFSATHRLATQDYSTTVSTAEKSDYYGTLSDSGGR